MKRYLLTFAILVLLVAGSAAPAQCRSTVFFIGGWGMTSAQMDAFSRSVPESRKVKYLLPEKLSELVRPWHCAAQIYDHLAKHELLEDDLTIVSFSLGGTVTQWLLDAHPELNVKKLILVGSPVGGYKFLPPNNFFSNSFPKGLPIYVIAGTKGQDAWFLKDTNDGVVDLESALDIPPENLKDTAIFHAGHTELQVIPEVQARIASWLDLDTSLPDNLMAESTSTTLPSNVPGSTGKYHN